MTKPDRPVNPRVRFERDLQAFWRQMQRRRVPCHVPKQEILNRRLPGSQFHDTPEIFFQIGGASDFECPVEKFRLHQGTICVMPRGVPHAETPVHTKTHYEIVVGMQGQEGMFLQRAKADANNRIQACETLFFPGVHIKEAFRYLDEISAHLTIGPDYRATYITRLVELFIIRMLSEIKKTEQSRSPSGSPLVLGMETLIRTRLSDASLTLADLAATLGCSPDHLTRKFRSERGINPKEWLARQRITHAIDLLADYRRNVSEIAWACGFKESSYFIKVFRSLTGITPRAFRARLSEQQRISISRRGELKLKLPPFCGQRARTIQKGIDSRAKDQTIIQCRV